MKKVEQLHALELRKQGYSILEISKVLHVAKSSVSLWVRNIELTHDQLSNLSSRPFTSEAIEKRRITRLANELSKRERITNNSRDEIKNITRNDLWLMGVMLYCAEGGKTQRLVRFSNGDPRMIKVMMKFFRSVCNVPEGKFRGYIHIHPHLDYKKAEHYWSNITGIPLEQFFKTYRIPNKSSQNKKDTLPNGVLDIYVLDVVIFLKIMGWAEGIYETIA